MFTNILGHDFKLHLLLKRVCRDMHHLGGDDLPGPFEHDGQAFATVAPGLQRGSNLDRIVQEGQRWGLYGRHTNVTIGCRSANTHRHDPDASVT